MASVILGTAGHIDHGKTSLVRALTGTDTDRLKEEKERGITIELGFAELSTPRGFHFGVVDVPGHEAFVRAMVAGATGMDVVLLVVAADEGVMPQTREHLAIVQLLGVSELLVALTKCDTVEPDWLELVEADIDELLQGTPYQGAPRVATSSVQGTGLEALVEALEAAAQRARRTDEEDLARLPLDRVFTIQGTGTVVTGTMWSGAVETGAKVRVLPEDLGARVRSLQVHGRGAERATAGDRVAAALTGEGGDRSLVRRGATLVASPEWHSTWMLTARADMLGDTEWLLEHNQRVHVHLGTAEVLARVALLEPEPLGAGTRGWVQIRLESPLVARAGDRLVLRAYSPVTTIGGAVVAEPNPKKRARIDEEARSLLDRCVDGSEDERLGSALDLAQWEGVRRGALAIASGLTPSRAEEALRRLVSRGALVGPSRVFGEGVATEARALALAAVRAAQTHDALRAAVPLAEVRGAFPGWADGELAGAVLGSLTQGGDLEAADGGVRTPGFVSTMTPDQERASEALLHALTAEGLAPPMLEELPDALRQRRDLKSLIRRLESIGAIRSVADGLYLSTGELELAAARIRSELGGRTGLGPADFRDVLAVTRKHLIPLLNYFDGLGVTVRVGEGRDVPAG